MSHQHVLVTNADAGSADSDAIRRALDTLRSGGPVEVQQTSTPDELDTVVRELDGRRLVVAGGDGSLHAAVNALHRASALADTVVGLIPLGTGNDLARTADIPLDPVEAARIVVSGKPTSHELLEGQDDTVAINAVHIGIGAEAVRIGASAKKRLGPAGYPVGAAMAGVRFAGWNLEVTVDGERQPRDGRVLMVGISVGRTIGGGAPLAPDAEVNDGLADVTVASSTGAVRRMRFAARLRNGEHRELRDVHTKRGREIVVSGDPVRANTDGEVSEERTRWTWTVRPRAWQLIHP